jgi:ribosome-associated heat shock protein Hsp15
MDPKPSSRMDKWLWSVRLYRSRSLATEACASGKVQINGQPVKPARSVQVGDIVTAVTGSITRTVKVLTLLQKRVGAKLVPRYLEDLTPRSEYEKQRQDSAAATGRRPPGSGRPTKRDRRILQSFFGHPE